MLKFCLHFFWKSCFCFASKTVNENDRGKICVTSFMNDPLTQWQRQITSDNSVALSIVLFLTVPEINETRFFYSNFCKTFFTEPHTDTINTILASAKQAVFLFKRTKNGYDKLKLCRFPESRIYFLAKDIFIAEVGVILNPCRASLAEADWISFSNSTKAMSWRPGTSRTSLNPGNWKN